MKKLILCFLVSASLIACTDNKETIIEENVTIASDNAKPDLASIKAEIQVLEAFWDSASNAGDFTTLMTIYSDDIIEISNLDERTEGKVKAQKSIESSYKEGKIVHSKTTDVFGGGDNVTEVGEFTNTYKDGKITTGKYICVWRKENGKYLIVAEMNNLDVKPN
jgi:hypothetical protein